MDMTGHKKINPLIPPLAAAIGLDSGESVHRLYGVRAVPSALLIDRRGVVSP